MHPLIDGTVSAVRQRFGFAALDDTIRARRRHKLDATWPIFAKLVTTSAKWRREAPSSVSIPALVLYECELLPLLANAFVTVCLHRRR